MLGHNHNNPLLPLSFLIMVLCPFVFLGKEGRWKIGLTKPDKSIWLAWAALLGGAMATICFLLGYIVFGTTENNWFMTVGNFYTVTPEMAEFPMWALFLMFTIPALIFSPFGEELFFRGFMQSTLEQRLTPKAAMSVVAIIFAGIHLFHHGVARENNEFKFYFLSGCIWFGLIFTTSILFEICRRKSGCIWASVICHMSFNLFMNIFIFAFLFAE